MFKISLGFHANNFSVLCNAAKGVVLGKPHWLAYQNRLLGPYLVEFISYVGNFDYCVSLKLFNAIMIATEYLIFYIVLLKLSKNSYALSLTYLMYFSLMFLGIQHYWSYTWDHIDIVVFTIFAYFIFSKKTTIYFALLFLLEITNRESALFIALFIIIDSFHFRLPLRVFKVSLCNKKQLVIGSALLIGGALYTKFIREFLFIGSSVKGVGDDFNHQLIGNHVQILINLEKFGTNFTSFNVINSVFILYIVIYLFSYINKFNEVQFKSFILFIGMLFSIFLFGLINETRMYTIILPFLIFFHLSLKESNCKK